MKILPLNKWTHSDDEEYWCSDLYEKEEDAIEEAKDMYEDYFYIGKAYSINFTEDDIDMEEYIIDKLCDCIEDEVPEGSDNWYNNISQDDKAILNDYVAKAVMKWIEERKLQPDCYIIDNIKNMTME